MLTVVCDRYQYWDSLQFEDALKQLEALQKKLKHVSRVGGDVVLCELWNEHKDRLKDHEQVAVLLRLLCKFVIRC